MLTHLEAVLTQPALWIACAIAYLLGSIPFGLVFAKWIKGIDLRQFGSGNIGASNAGRALGRRWAIAVFFCDFLKGCLPVLALRFVPGLDPAHVPMMQLFVGTAAVLGHCYSIYLKFQGGKAVATGCGAIVAVDWTVFVAGGIVWLITRRVTRYNGLASILMSITWPIAAWLRHDPPEIVLGTALLALLILVRHRSNIGRMLAGTEPRAGDKSAAAESSASARPHG